MVVVVGVGVGVVAVGRVFDPFLLAAGLLDPVMDPDLVARGVRPWREVRRGSQVTPPGDWFMWLILAGRGWGKTRTGAEWLIDEMVAYPHYRYGMMGASYDEIRDVMVEGESGLIECLSARGLPFDWNKSLGHLSVGGARCEAYSAHKPSGARGPNLRCVWGDEPGSWEYGQDAFDTLAMGMRKGDVRFCMTGTPKPSNFVRWLVSQADVLTRGSTDENSANLSGKFLDRVVGPYRGTRLGRQEIDAELLEDVQGALWRLKDIEGARVGDVPFSVEDVDGELVELVDLVDIVVAVDPAVSNKSTSDETGIVVAGRGVDGDFYVLGDYSLRCSTNEWAVECLASYDRHLADRVLAEVNNGGDLVEASLRSYCTSVGRVFPSYRAVHAARGKIARAEPVHALYEQGRVHHVGLLAGLEDEMTGYVWNGTTRGVKSPNRIDALVWAISALAMPKAGRKLRMS